MTPENKNKIRDEITAAAIAAMPVIDRFLKKAPDFCERNEIDLKAINPNVIESLRVDQLTKMIKLILGELESLNIDDSEKYELASAVCNLTTFAHILLIDQNTHYQLLELISMIKRIRKSNNP